MTCRVLLFTLCTLTTAEKILETTTGRKVRYEPKVTFCDPVCIFKDKTNKFCFYTLDPMMRLGWEWIQIYGTTTVTTVTETPLKYYQLQLAPYGKAMGYIEMILDVSRFIFVDFIADLAQFKSRIWGSVIFTSTGSVCWGIGYDTEKIGLVLTLQHGFMDCLKSFILSLCDPSSQWSGIDAKYFTKCDRS